MASANMVSASAPAISKAALGQTATASGNSSLGKSSFTGACIPVSSRRVARRAERKVCMSAAKDETHKIAAPLRKGLAAGLLAATIATSSGPAYADDAIAKVEQRWGQITQKARKATSEAKSTFSPAIDSLNKKNTLAETTANKIPQRSKPSFGAKKNDGTSRVNVSFTEAPPLRFVGLDTKGTPADPETVKDDAIGGITDPASIPGRIKERAGTIASKLPNLPSIDQAVPGNKGIKDIAPDLVEGSSEKIPQRSAPSFGTGKQRGQNVSFSQAVPLRYVGLDTKGTPADPETVKDDAIGGITDPASIPGRVKERAETIASKLPSLPSLPSLGGADTKGTPADPETVKDDAIGGVTDPASIPGRVKERAGTIASKLPNAPSLPSAPSLPNADQLVPGNKGVKDVAPDIVEGSSDKIKLKEKPRFGAFGGDGFNRKNVDLTSAPTLQFVGLNTKGTPLDPATVKDDAIGGVTDPASIPGRVKDRAETIASKLPNAPSLPKLPNAGDILPGKKDLKDVAPDLVEGSSDKIQQRGRPSFGQYGGANRTNVDFTSAPTLQFVGLDTKGTPLDPATVKDDAIGGVTDPASIPGRVKERAGTIASKLPNAPSLPNAGDVLPGKKDLKDVAPDLVEGSSDKIQQRGRPSFGQYGGANRTNVDFTSAPTLQFVGLNTKGTPADPATVKDDVVGGVTDPASIPGRVKDRAQTIASKLPSLPKFGSPDTKGTPADPETVKDDAIGGVTNPASIPGRVKERAGTIASKLPNAPSVPSGSPDTKGTPADPQTVKDDAIGGITDPASIPGRVKERAETIASKLPNLPSFGSPDTKGTPADPETVKDDAIGGITDPASIPGRIKERAGTIASKLPNAPSLPSVDQVLPGDKGIKDVAPDLVEGSSEKIPQRSAPSYGTQNAETGRTNVTFSSTPSLQFVGIDTKGTPADPATVKDDLVGGVTDPASIPGRIKERANTIASKLPDLPSLPNADKAVPGNKGVKDLAPDLVEGSSEKLPQRSAASN